MLAIDGQSRAGDGGDAERALVDSFSAIGDSLPVAFELFDVGQPVVRREHRLGSLQVRVGGQDNVKVILTTRKKRGLQIDQQRIDFIEGLPDPHSGVRADLVVSAASGVQFAAGVANPINQGLFDMHVDVFELEPHRQFAAIQFTSNGFQSVLDEFEFLVRQQIHVAKHVRVGDRSANVVLVQPRVKTDAFGVCFQSAIGFGLEDTTSRRAGHG